MGIPIDAIHMPAGGIAIFGRTGAGKSGLFYWSDYVRNMIIADTGSLSHKLYFKHGEPTVIDSQAKDSPIEQVVRSVEAARKAGKISILDSWSTLQEQEVAYAKRTMDSWQRNSLKYHQIIVGRFRDLALVLAQAPVFTIFNTAPGGRGKTPTGEEVVYPAGALTGYPSLNGTAPNSETILARWPTVWGCFMGYKNGEKDIPRGLYVPGADIRPEAQTYYAPLKDPLMVIQDNSGGSGIMKCPDLRLEENRGACFIDNVLEQVAGKWPRMTEEERAARFIEQAKARQLAEEQANAKITSEQAATLLDKMTRAGADLPKFLAYFKISDLSALPAREYADCDKQVEAKLKSLGK